MRISQRAAVKVRETEGENSHTRVFFDELTATMWEDLQCIISERMLITKKKERKFL